MAAMNERLANLKREAFPDEGKEERISKSLAALNEPSLITLSAEELKALMEEVQ